MTTTTDRPDLATPYWTHAHLAAVLPFGRTRRFEVIREPDFPAPLRLTRTSDPVWVAAEVRAWLESRPRIVWEPKGRRLTTHLPPQDELDLRPVTGRRRRAS